jgi:hypothetical protein
MSNRLKHNLLTALIYSVVVYIIILPLKLWVIGISISILIGFFFGLLNDIITQLRKLNGEKFTNIEDDK